MPTKSFPYLAPDAHYFDSACQSLRPQEVINAEMEYYTTSNACGGRGNYEWSHKVDKKILEAREAILKYVGKTSDEYTVVFTPNTTYGINLLVHNIQSGSVSQIATTHKEHNSVWLPSISWSRSHQRGLITLDRTGETIDIRPLQTLQRILLIIATHSNIDGLGTANLQQAVNHTKRNGGLVILDACQTLAHAPFDFGNLDFDALVGSGHKLYAPSIGFMVIKKSFIKELDQTWVGGGTVQKVSGLDYELINLDSHIHERLELGLQDYGAIFGLERAINWLYEFNPEKEYQGFNGTQTLYKEFMSRYTFAGNRKNILAYMNLISDYLFTAMIDLTRRKKITLLNSEPSSITSFVPHKSSAHDISKNLSKSGIMCRSGYMCAHHYVQDILKTGQVVRISLGLHNTIEEISYLISNLDRVLN